MTAHERASVSSRAMERHELMPDDTHMDEPVTPTPTLPHQGEGDQRRRGLEATPEDPADPAQMVADLQCQLAECGAERDQAREYQTATRLTHPPPSRGRARVGVIALIGVGVTDRLAAGVIPRTDPW